MAQNISVPAAVATTVAENAPFKLMRRSSFMLTDSSGGSGGGPSAIKGASLRRRNSKALQDMKSKSHRTRDQVRSSQISRSLSEQSLVQADETSSLLGDTGTGTRHREGDVQLRYTDQLRQILDSFVAFLRSDPAKNVLKSSLAYFIASLVVYTPIGTYLYGHTDNKHLVATVVVYFHPARTGGSMAEAILFVTISLLYSLVTASTCMVISALLIGWNLVWLSYVVDLLVFCGVGLGVVAFFKRKVNLATFNTACSLASIFLASILVREGNVQTGQMSWAKLFQSYMLVVSGCIISSVVCYFIWPQSAVMELKNTLNQILDFDSELLEYISEKFLDGGDVETDEFETLKKESSDRFAKLDKHLRDSQKELYLKGNEREYAILERLVLSDHRLALHLGGLTSSAKILWHLMTEAHDTDDDDDNSVDYYEDDHSSSSVGESSVGESDRCTEPTELFHLFADHLGPPTRSFYISLRTILDKIPFEDDPPYLVSNMSNLQTNLSLATDLYSRARETALQELYGQDSFKTEQQDFETTANAEGIAASCGNFSYVLEDYANELKVFLEALAEYDELVSMDPPPQRTYSWMKFFSRKRTWKNPNDIEHSVVRFMGRVDTGSLQKSENANLGLKIWRSFRVFRRTDIQFGIKVGVGALLFAIPAYLESTRDIFTLWRGEWGLTIYCIIMNKSVGGTSTTIGIRFLGTFLGACVAYIAWTLFPANEYVLGFVGWLMSLGCFWIILNWKSSNPFGRFILLTFNLVAMYSYSLSANDNDDDDDEGGGTPIVGEIAFHRFVSVLAGVLWALFISTAIWPNSARKRLRRILSTLWLQMGLVWKSDAFRTSSINSHPDGVRFSGISGETELHKTMIELQSLLKDAPSEFRLKGPFPVDTYKKMLASTQTILDAYQNISVLMLKYPNPTSRELELVSYTSSERQELGNRIFLFFYLASSAMRLGFPLPDKLPSTEHALDRMLAKLNTYRLECIRKSETSNEPIDEEDFVLFYTYILVTVTITEELSKISQEVQSLFGIIEEELFDAN